MSANLDSGYGWPEKGYNQSPCLYSDIQNNVEFYPLLRTFDFQWQAKIRWQLEQICIYHILATSEITIPTVFKDNEQLSSSGTRWYRNQLPNWFPNQLPKYDYNIHPLRYKTVSTSTSFSLRAWWPPLRTKRLECLAPCILSLRLFFWQAAQTRYYIICICAE
jgi:hypothetical protein